MPARKRGNKIPKSASPRDVAVAFARSISAVDTNTTISQLSSQLRLFDVCGACNKNEAYWARISLSIAAPRFPRLRLSACTLHAITKRSHWTRKDERDALKVEIMENPFRFAVRGQEGWKRAVRSATSRGSVTALKKDQRNEVRRCLLIDELQSRYVKAGLRRDTSNAGLAKRELWATLQHALAKHALKHKRAKKRNVASQAVAERIRFVVARKASKAAQQESSNVNNHANSGEEIILSCSEARTRELVDRTIGVEWLSLIRKWRAGATPAARERALSEVNERIDAAKEHGDRKQHALSKAELAKLRVSERDDVVSACAKALRAQISELGAGKFVEFVEERRMWPLLGDKKHGVHYWDTSASTAKAVHRVRREEEEMAAMVVSNMCAAIWSVVCASNAERDGWSADEVARLVDEDAFVTESSAAQIERGLFTAMRKKK